MDEKHAKISIKARPIKLEEWGKYEWHHIGGGAFLRGIKKTIPPDDGYKYVECTTFLDAEQKWMRAITPSD